MPATATGATCATTSATGATCATTTATGATYATTSATGATPPHQDPHRPCTTTAQDSTKTTATQQRSIEDRPGRERPRLHLGYGLDRRTDLRQRRIIQDQGEEYSPDETSATTTRTPTPDHRHRTHLHHSLYRTLDEEQQLHQDHPTTDRVHQTQGNTTHSCPTTKDYDHDTDHRTTKTHRICPCHTTTKTQDNSRRHYCTPTDTDTDHDKPHDQTRTTQQTTNRPDIRRSYGGGFSCEA